MVDLAEIVQQIKSHLPPLKVERVSLPEALGRIVAEDLFAPEDVPSYPRSAMDGYAVRAEDIATASRDNPVILTVVDQIPAGSAPKRPLRKGEAAAIATGAPLPEGADTVVRVEDTKPVNFQPSSVSSPVSSGYYSVAILVATPKGKNISPVGEDVRKGELIARKGQKVTPALIGLLATCGFFELPVFARPSAAVIPTGNELVDVTAKPSIGQVRNSTAWAIAGALKECGVEPSVFEPVRDDIDELARRFEEAINSFDLVITCGGVSVGQGDLVREAWKRLGAKVICGHLPLRPGKAFLAVTWEGHASCPLSPAPSKVAFGLSGNPAAALTTFDLILRPALCEWTGSELSNFIPINAELSAPVSQVNGFWKALRVSLEQRDGRLLANPLKGQLSTVLSSLVQSDGYALIPPGNGSLETGTKVTVLARPSKIAFLSEWQVNGA
jgi:molybdopterin molybdotransferase